MKLKQIIDAFKLKVLSEGPEDMEVVIANVNRCGMNLGGFYGHFDERRVQIIGKAEHALLETFSPDEYQRAMVTLLDKEIPGIILTNDLTLSDEVIDYARKSRKWILSTERETSDYLIDQALYLQNQLAPSITIHGVLLDLFGIGVLIKGDSGIGKSVTAIELIRRGHLFVADDVVIVKKLSSHLLVGEPQQLTKNLIECRGVGIVNVNSLFGKSAVRQSATIDMIIGLHKWDDEKNYKGIGEVIETETLMGVELPVINIPVKPGQLVPTSIIEIGALNLRQNQMGYNTARELLKSVRSMMSPGA
ncbi:HPr(Ser) kinase/phosphatase [Anaerotalea alkaliphila]|uniref:HPr(Ser) kinase/phosphatase n=1 Tax=Anaerotalea alkaliphila TaxID=2662126 RepID=A0A7X5KM70_9FIRM|nr:HPr(Ser) kinase/phosphatase [Anaerotalea alkaliphila]NDL66408.1 HPr(Ser) kinase/phosphatase [Anaerotalea alkaliphila]